MSLKDALQKAFADKGLSLPSTKNTGPQRIGGRKGAKEEKQPVVITYGRSAGGRAGHVNTQSGKSERIETGQKSKKTNRSPTNLQAIKRSPLMAEGGTVAASVQTDGPKLGTHQRMATRKVIVETDAKCLLDTGAHRSLKLLDVDTKVGRRTSIDQVPGPEIHEMTFGLDFGTSSVKVVIGDLASDKTFAIPFIDAQGIDAFLLPSRLFESNGHNTGVSDSVFTITDGAHAFRDLKLSLLADPGSIERQVEVIAFLALVIQRARAWYFAKHQSVYKRVRCLWQLRIGLPAATALNNEFVPLLHRILQAAWQVASIAEVPSRQIVRGIRDRAFEGGTFANEPEVQVIPEIAAQIYGFVVSTSFDRKAENRYLMVDVGAGTVDSSLFKVIPDRGGRWSFEFYTAVVQPYGVANLHACRVEWWCALFSGIEGANRLIEVLRANQFATDHIVTLPARNREYFSGVTALNDDPDDVDSKFFDKRLMSQIQGSTLWRAVHDGFLTKEQLSGVPMFLCGGGGRSSFYSALKTSLKHLPGYSWLSAEPWQLGFPSDLEAEDLQSSDFDRLSVAYGLSKVNVGRVTQAMPLPRVPIDPQKPFTDRYIDKDQI